MEGKDVVFHFGQELNQLHLLYEIQEGCTISHQQSQIETPPKIVTVGSLFQLQYTKFLSVKTDTDTHPSESVRHDTSPPPHWSDHSEQHNIYWASSDVTREGDNTFISIPSCLAMSVLPL